MTLSKPLQIALGAVLLTLLGGFVTFLTWLGGTVRDIETGQAAMDARLDFTSNRVERIVQEVPTLRRAIVQETNRAPVQQVIVTTPPVRVDSATSIAAINVIDVRLRETKAHYLTLSNDQLRTFEAAMRGVVTQAAPNALSFRDVIVLSSGESPFVSGSTDLPAYVDRNASYLLWVGKDSVPIRAINAMYGVDSTRTHPIKLQGRTWMNMFAEVSSRPNIYSLNVVVIPDSMAPRR